MFPLHRRCRPLILGPVSPDRDLAADLAEEIRAAVAETASPQGGAVPTEPSGGEEDAARAALHRSEAHMTPVIPPSVRLGAIKRFLVRALRFLWRDQTAFNALVLEAANSLVGALATERGTRESEVSRLGGELAKAEADLRRSALVQHEQFLREVAIRDGRLALLEAASPRPAAESAASRPADVLPAGIYALFEDRFRGSPEEIERRQTLYLPLVRDLPGLLWDVGCGRGEFLSLLQREGIPAAGVEANPLAVAACRARGLEVVEGDGIAQLSRRETGSLGAVTAFQVVEHWTAAATFAFLREARRALAPGGVLIAETINTNSLSALKAFFLDPSHVRAVPPEALLFLTRAAGFPQPEIEYRNELPESERLAEDSENDRRLNRLLFGPQDYAVVARVPVEPSRPGRPA